MVLNYSVSEWLTCKSDQVKNTKMFIVVSFVGGFIEEPVHTLSKRGPIYGFVSYDLVSNILDV